VFRDSATAIGHEDIHTVLREMGRAVGPPWQAKHKLAAAAAIAASGQTDSSSHAEFIRVSKS